MQDPTEKHCSDLGILVKYKDNNNNNNNFYEIILFNKMYTRDEL